MNFGLSDYWRMYKAKGIKLAVYYFFQAHFFDLVHGTETHARITKENFSAQPDNFEHGVLYMCSWTSEIKNSFAVVRKLLKDEFEDYVFVDIGCGKGKVVMVWQGEVDKAGLSPKVYGIDYYAPFVELARENHRKVFGNIGNYENADATLLDFSSYGTKLIAYLYNPFDEIILAEVIGKIAEIPSMIVYNNPVHADLFARHGYEIAYQKIGFHPNANTIIFSNSGSTRRGNN